MLANAQNSVTEWKWSLKASQASVRNCESGLKHAEEEVETYQRWLDNRLAEGEEVTGL